MSATFVRSIETTKAFQELKQGLSPSALLVVFFYATWAAPCQQVQGVLDVLSTQYHSEDEQVTFTRIDAEELSEVSAALNVLAVPFVVLLRDGKVLEGIGGTNASQLRRLIEKHAGISNPSTVTSDAPLPSRSANPRAPELSNLASTNSAATSTDEQSLELDDALRKRLTELTHAAPVMLFMKGTPSAPECGFSRQIVAILRERSVRYGFFNILADDVVRQGLKELSEWPTFPQLYLQGELVGGLDIVKEELEQDADFFSEFVAAST